MARTLPGWVCLVLLGACNPVAPADAGEGTDSGATDAPRADGGTLTGAHPLYPALDLATLPGDRGSARGVYEPPSLPVTERTVTITSTGMMAGRDLYDACHTGGVLVEVPSAAGNIGVLTLGDIDDCDITLGADVVVSTLVIGSLPGPMLAPSHRIRIRGGQIATVFVAEETTDVVLDGVVINNGAVPSEGRPGGGIVLQSGMAEDSVVNRFAVVNSIIRMVPVPVGGGIFDGMCYLGSRARNVFFANDDVVTSGNRNSWGFRIGGGDNTLLIDISARVSFHKLVRMNDAPVDYVVIRGGTWMREATLTVDGMAINDSFQQLGSSTDHVFVQDLDVYLLSDQPVGFGMIMTPEQMGRTWEARRIHWHALSDRVISDASLMAFSTGCVAGATCDYGVGTHTYDYDAALTLPPSPWRSLPGLPADPDGLPTLP